MNKYTIMKQTFLVILAIAIVAVYTYLGLYSGSAMLALCAMVLWLGIIGWGLAGIFWWLTKKEKETGLGKEALVTKEKQPLYKKL